MPQLPNKPHSSPQLNPLCACAYEIESEIKERVAINHTRHLFGTPVCSNNFGQTQIMKSQRENHFCQLICCVPRIKIDQAEFDSPALSRVNVVI